MAQSKRLAGYKAGKLGGQKARRFTSFRAFKPSDYEL
jgi:hypothetical protein